MASVISEGCLDVKDTMCLDNCPVDCVYGCGRMVCVEADECADYGAGEPLRPQEAIFYEPDLPEMLTGYASVNAEFAAKWARPAMRRRSATPIAITSWWRRCYSDLVSETVDNSVNCYRSAAAD
jgi:NAD-dependent dihydropyrimidine dehydrogenase PreA subunit